MNLKCDKVSIPHYIHFCVSYIRHSTAFRVTQRQRIKATPPCDLFNIFCVCVCVCKCVYLYSAVFSIRIVYLGKHTTWHTSESTWICVRFSPRSVRSANCSVIHPLPRHPAHIVSCPLTSGPEQRSYVIKNNPIYIL